jgi:hypothetical protein
MCFRKTRALSLGDVRQGEEVVVIVEVSFEKMPRAWSLSSQPVMVISGTMADDFARRRRPDYTEVCLVVQEIRRAAVVLLFSWTGLTTGVRKSVHEIDSTFPTR